MTLNEILQSVRDELGESGEQFWKDAELVRWAHLALNRHAREALSIPTEVVTTTLSGVQEYELPEDFGELLNVRYQDDPLTGHVPLVYVDKQSILTAYGTLHSLGSPYACYIFQDKLGLYPSPRKSPTFEYKFESATTGHTFVDVLSDDTAFSSEIELSLEDSDANVETVDRLYISQVGVFLRRVGRPNIAADIWMTLRPVGDNTYTLVSKTIAASDIESVPAWYAFDFTLSPVEILSDAVTWELEIVVDEQYEEADLSEQGGPGVQVSVDDQNTAWFQLHSYRNDLQVDYYRNSVREILDHDEPLDLPFYPPARYHDTLVDMIVEKALRKGQFDLLSANDYRRRSEMDIKYARSQAKLKTQGDIMRVPQDVRLRQNIGPYVDYVSGRFVGRAW